MPLFHLNVAENKMTPIQPRKFADVNLRERRDLQKLLRANSTAIENVIGQKIKIIAEEFSNWEDSSRRVDLLALDAGEHTEAGTKANLIVIELKRVEEGGHMELQSIRYAAMLSGMDFNSVVQAYEKFSKKPTAEAQTELLAFLETPDAAGVLISKTPRIILISPSFSTEITTTVLWLNDEFELDIQCLEAVPYQIGDELYLDLEQVIPLPEAQEYIVQQREKTHKEEKQASITRGERTVPMLVDRGILNTNDRLYLIKLPKPGLVLPTEKAKHATFISDQEIRWDFDGKSYSSLSRLCRKICEEFGGDVGSGAFQGPLFWAKEGQNKSLADIAKALPPKQTTSQ